MSDESAVAKQEILASWRDTPTTRAISDFVAKATTEGEPLYLPPAERVAVFDNDGTHRDHDRDRRSNPNSQLAIAVQAMAEPAVGS